MTSYTSGCLVCGKDLNYHFNAQRLKCELCGREADTTVLCEDGHFVCDKCHAKNSYTYITNYCLLSDSWSPTAIASELMKDDSIKMHGPEHHYIVAAALLTAFKNVSGQIDLEDALKLALQRASKVPGGICGNWGSCGAGIGAGIFVSIITGATPKSRDEWYLANLMTSQALKEIAENGGPQCCKRTTLIAILMAEQFINQHFNVYMGQHVSKDINCPHSHRNPTCRKYGCMFYPNANTRKKVAFICVHNSCRSQIAEALGRHYAQDMFDSYSAGTETKPNINRDAVRLMKELYDIDMEAMQYSKLLNDLPDVDFVITMGCNVECPSLPCEYRDDWGIEDPTGKSDEEFIAVIKEIERKILELKGMFRKTRGEK